MSISIIGRSIGKSVTLLLNETAAILKAKGEPLIHLGGGEPESRTPIDAITNFTGLLNSGEIRYTPVDGTIEMKQAIIRYTEEYYDRKVDPENIIFLTADAQGVLPPIARLNMNQAIYHFISGYTSKIAGTELGLGIEPEITFSACFGAPFMVHHPFYYADLLRKKAEKTGVTVWLVNTGWVGGKFGVGKRISIRHTRNMLNAALEGKLDNVEYRTDKLFGFKVPLSCPGVHEDVFDPSSAWGNKDEYWIKYDALAARYIENFKIFAGGVPGEIMASGPKRLKK